MRHPTTPTNSPPPHPTRNHWRTAPHPSRSPHGTGPNDVSARAQRATVLFDSWRPPSADIAAPEDSQLALKQPLVLGALAAAVLAGGVAVALRRGSAA